MKMFIQFLALMALVMCAFAADYPHYADPGQCKTIQQWNGYSVIANCPKPDGTWVCSILVSNLPVPAPSGDPAAVTVRRLTATFKPARAWLFVCFLLIGPERISTSATPTTLARSPPREDGGFSSSCNDCYWTNTVLHCNCDINPGHSFMQPQIETNLLLVNAKGFMQCFDRVADKCPHGTAPTGTAPPAFASTAPPSATVTPAREARLMEKKAFHA
ncbi:hypothetical protein PG997_014495 [Apiospora hydei]|uniref:Uncharacterized protein n=1 Tax=Apiospora hydei TaxID=1337664 RepID=A0ABR1UTZ4_9PEZI